MRTNLKLLHRIQLKRPGTWPVPSSSSSSFLFSMGAQWLWSKSSLHEQYFVFMFSRLICFLVVVVLFMSFSWHIFANLYGKCQLFALWPFKYEWKKYINIFFVVVVIISSACKHLRFVILPFFQLSNDVLFVFLNKIINSSVLLWLFSQPEF